MSIYFTIILLYFCTQIDAQSRRSQSKHVGGSCLIGVQDSMADRFCCQVCRVRGAIVISGRSKVLCITGGTNITTNKLRWYHRPSAIVLCTSCGTSTVSSKLRWYQLRWYHNPSVIVVNVSIVNIVDCRVRGVGSCRDRVKSRVAAEAAGPVVQLTRKVPLARGDSGVGRMEVSLARSLSFTSVEALVREDSPMWPRGRSREEAVMAAEREVGVVLSHR